MNIVTQFLSKPVSTVSNWLSHCATSCRNAIFGPKEPLQINHAKNENNAKYNHKPGSDVGNRMQNGKAHGSEKENSEDCIQNGESDSMDFEYDLNDAVGINQENRESEARDLENGSDGSIRNEQFGENHAMMADENGSEEVVQTDRDSRKRLRKRGAQVPGSNRSTRPKNRRISTESTSGVSNIARDLPSSPGQSALQKLDVSKPRTQWKSYLDAYDEELQEECEEMYLTIQSKKEDFQLPNLTTLSEEGKDKLQEFGRETKRYCAINSERGQAPVFVILNQKLGERIGYQNLLLPQFEYLTKNIFHGNTENFFKTRSICNKPITDEKLNLQLKHGRTNCNTKKICYCETRRQFLFKNSKVADTHLFYNNIGHLEMDNYNDERANFHVIECSDACGCNMTCPQRTLQRGSQIPLAIISENENLQLGVRTGKNISRGQLICEMVGGIIHNCSNPIGKRSENVALHYTEGPYYLCVKLVGNVGRFVNHSCLPNAFIVSVFAKVNECEQFIPRIGIFALRDIEKGEQIFFKYNDEDPRQKGIESSVCECGADKCQGMVAFLDSK